MNQHLTSQQISEWILGEHPAGLERHLGQCSGCKDRVESLESKIFLLRTSARHAGAEYVGKARFPLPPESSRRFWFGVSWVRFAAIACGLALIASLPIYHHARQVRIAEEMAREDDLLLTNVQSAVSRSAPLQMQSVSELMDKTGYGQ